MMKKPLNQLEGMQDWLKNEIKKDQKELELDKLKFLNEIKNFKKDDIIPNKKDEVKLTLWQKLKKMLLG
jgi:hypothetical protein